MPLTRPKSRNKSRSPAVTASVVQTPTTPRGFLPPSHYAAAAGIPYHSPRDDTSPKARSRSEAPADRREHTSHATSSHLPVSSSASSSEQPGGSRMAMLTRRLSRGASNPSKSSGKRQSQLADLPLVEAHLVPSLRDTIDRMTNSGDSPTGAQASSSQTTPSRSSSTPHPPALANAQSITSPPSRLRRPMLSVKTSAAPTTPSMPKTSSGSKVAEMSRIPTSAPKAKSKPALKSVLKSSASSASASVAYSKQTSGPESPSKSSPSKSLRSVRNIISRKSSQAPPVGNTTPEPPPFQFSSPYRAHERSRTDPGYVSARPSFVPVPATPQPYASHTAKHARPGHDTKQQRPSSRNYAAGLSEESLPEFELLREPRRALMVTNAEIVPSCSSSSSGTDRQLAPKSPSWSSRVPLGKYGADYAQAPPLPERRVGLGITGLNEKTGGGLRHEEHVPPSDEDLAGRATEEEGSLYEEESGLTDEPSSESIARLHSLLRSRSRQQVRFEQDEREQSSAETLPNPWEYEDAEDPEQSEHDHDDAYDEHQDDRQYRDNPRQRGEDARYRGDSRYHDNAQYPEDAGYNDGSRYDNDERRRRAALLGIVNELEHGGAPAEQDYASEDPSDGEYSGQQGLAISPSTDFGKQGSARILGVGDEHRPGQPGSRAYGGRGSALHFSPRSRAVPPPPSAYSPNPPRQSPLSFAKGRAGTAAATRAPINTQEDDQSASEYTDDDEDGQEFEPHQDEQTPRVTYSTGQFSESNARVRDPSRLLSPDNFGPNSRRHNTSPGIVVHPPVPNRLSSEHTAPVSYRNSGPSAHDRDRIRGSRTPPARSPVVQPPPPRASSSMSHRHSHYEVEGPPAPRTSACVRRSRQGATNSVPPKEGLMSETYSLHESLNIAEAREREAFGLRPSSPESDGQLPAAESASTIASDRWQDNPEEISFGAEAIFEQLANQRHASVLRNSWMHQKTSEPRRPAKPPETSMQYGGNNGRFPTAESHAGLSESSNLQSIYKDEIPDRPWQQRERDQRVLGSTPEGRTWRSTLPPSAYHSLLERYGDTELRRQQVIWDLCEAEQVFVKRLRTVVYLFIRPLRMKDSITWLEGVPPEAARLFDWLEDIINLHSQISSALRAAIAEQYPVVTRIAEVIRSFVPRLEVHQPYLVRVERVALLIQRMAHENGNDFGEFIRIQQEQPECQGWSLEAFLVEPVNRLVDYPEYFHRLWEVTPRNHVDHLSTFSLLHSTETMIRIMREVKLREEEYDLVKDRLSKIQGLPSSIQLARRERRLLARGRVIRDLAPEPGRGSGGGEFPDRKDQYLRPSTTSNSETTHFKQSKLMTAIRSRAPTLSARSNSTKSSASSNFSLDSHMTTSSSTPPITPQSPLHYGGPMISGSHGSHDHHFTAPRSTLLNLRRNETFKQSVLHTLVFTDLIILASPIRDTSGHQSDMNGAMECWRLLEDVGISRILSVSSNGDSIVLDLLPLDITDLETGIIPDSAPVASITISIPQSSSSGEGLEPTVMADIKRKWISAFRQCSQHTVRALSFPSQSGKYLARGPDVDWEEDSQRSVMAILASGLPLPKSPSIQISEVMQGRAGDDAQQEREERGWWSLRFQQVLREMQRGEVSSIPQSSLALGVSSTEITRKRPGVSRPRPLKLSSLSSSESLGHLPSNPRN